MSSIAYPSVPESGSRSSGPKRVRLPGFQDRKDSSSSDDANQSKSSNKSKGKMKL